MIAAELAAQLTALLGQAGVEAAPSGLLAWFGVSQLPDGRRRAPPLTQSGWETHYARLQSGALSAGIAPPLYALKAPLRDAGSSGPLSLAVADFRYSTLRPEVARRIAQAARAGHALDPAPGPLAGLLEERRGFFATALMADQWLRATPVCRSRDVTFQLDPALWLAQPGVVAPERVSVDAGDGRGFRRLRLGDSFSAEYPEGDEALITLRCTVDGRARTARLRLALGAPALPRPDETWVLRPDVGNSGRAWVFRAPGHAQVERPLIIAEGFPGGYSSDYLYEVLTQAGTLAALQRAGYDVIFVSFDQGMDRVQNNAAVVEACIQEAQRRTATPLVVGGLSMGGLVARYALAAMEQRGIAHNTRVFLSIDSPQGGAYTSVADQWMAQYFRTVSPQLAGLAALLDAPSNQQFVKWWVHQGRAQVSPLRTALLAELEALGGYPRQLRRLGVACGSGDGRRTVAPAQPTVVWSRSPFASARLWTLPERRRHKVGEGYCFLTDARQRAKLSMHSDLSWDGAPGAVNIYNGLVAEAARQTGCGHVRSLLPVSCSVPTVSALDLDCDPFQPVPAPGSGASPFDDYVCNDANEHHLVLTPKIRDWLLSRLSAASPT